VNVKTLLRSAWDSILRNRVRSLLTMLGVIIGVAAVVITISIGVGARVAIAQQITSLGSNLVIVLPGSVNLNGVRTGTGGASTLTVEDGLAIAKLPHVAAASPMVISRAQVISGQNNWQTQVVGVAPTYTYIRQWHLASGSSFTDADVASSAKVCVLGKTVVDNLFPDGSSPIGKTITVRNVPFTVVGVLSMRGQNASGQDQDDVVIVPYTSQMQRLAGTLSARWYVNAIGASADGEQYIPLVQTEIIRLLEQRHRIIGACKTISTCAICSTSQTRPLQARQRWSIC
jgi:putative ABC transport system permease protein